MKPKPPLQHRKPRAIVRPVKRQAQMNSIIIGAFAIVAVFVGLEMSRPEPKETVTAATDSIPVAVAKPAAAEQAAITDEPTVSPTPAPEVVASDPVPAVTPAVTPAVENTEIAKQAKADDFAAEEPLVLTGLDAGRDAAIGHDKKMFAKAIEGRAWDGYRAFLVRSISVGMARTSESQGVTRYNSVWKEPALYQALLRWEVLGKFSSSRIAGLVKDNYSGEMLNWLCHNDGAMEEFLLTIQPEDDGGKVLKFLMDVWDNSKDKIDKYFPLALACAVVFDRDIAISNPVGNGTYSADGSSAKVSGMERFRWFMEENEKTHLAAPVDRSSARDLVWVVCAPVSTSELEWSLKKMHLSRKKWGDAYGMIKYLMERAVKGINPYKEYSFSEILKEGGICGDRSYFCTNTARAQGIPAMTLGGETDLGGHAWVAMKIKPDEWTTGIGRIGGVSKGATGNPQTGKTITEQEIQLWGDRAHQSPATTINVARHLWLADYFGATGNDAAQDTCTRLANQIGPSFTETWAALFEQFKARTKLTGDPVKPNNLEDWKWFSKSMRHEFKDNPRMASLAAKAEDEFIFPYGDEGDTDRLLLRERRRIARDSGEQADLIAASLKRQADLILKRGDSTAKRDIGRLYDSALRRYGANITGFKTMADDYFNFCRDDPEYAPKAARDIELAFKRVVETGTKEWFRAKTESSIYQMICGYYRAAGNEARAVMLEKRYQILLKHAERGAL